MVVMRRLTGNVGVLAARQVDALDDAEVDQDVERPEHRRAADPHAQALGVRDEVGRREVGVAPPDQLRHGASRPGQPVAGLLEGVDEGCGAVIGRHARMILSRNKAVERAPNEGQRAKGEVAPPGGFEPPTNRLEGGCSVH